MDERIELIKKNTQLVIAQLGPLSEISFGLNKDSVAWVEGFIERQRARPDFNPDAIDGLVNVLGSFLGECLIANAGGAWHWSDNGQEWSIAFSDKNHAFPFVKV